MPYTENKSPLHAALRLLYTLLICVLLCLSGCESAGAGSADEKEAMYAWSKDALHTCEDIFSEEEDDPSGICMGDTLDASRDTVSGIVSRLGDAGYCAVDTDSRINMENAGLLRDFCTQAQAGAAAEVRMVVVKTDGGLVCYHFRADNGELYVERCTAGYEDGKIHIGFYTSFQAVRWEYTQKGYFLFEEYVEPGFDGPPGEYGFRVEPLNEELRALTEQYVSPVGYTGNNMLITDWREDTGFEPLDLYDMYDIMYHMKYGGYQPHSFAPAGEKCEVPARQFEDALQTHFNISIDVIRQKADYLPESDAYLYLSRGMGDLEQPYHPVPEVTACEELADGTMRLTVEAVWIRDFTDCAAVSELVVRPLDDGGFQYVSCRVTKSIDGVTGRWHTPRLSGEDWAHYYGKSDTQMQTSER